jgi:hypothetical protein
MTKLTDAFHNFAVKNHRSLYKISLKINPFINGLCSICKSLPVTQGLKL